jgi:hypothetical protein
LWSITRTKLLRASNEVTNTQKIDGLVLAVYDIEAARDNLIARDVEVSEVFHYAGGPLNSAALSMSMSGIYEICPSSLYDVIFIPLAFNVAKVRSFAF